MKIRQRSDAVEADQSAVGLPPSELKWLDSDWGQACKTLLLMMAVIGAGVLLLNSLWAGSTVTTALNQALASPQLWGFVAVGLAAQAIDGSLGMAYGVTANSLLMAQGVPPAAATTAVHLSEVFTTGFSGAAHYRLGNFNRRLFLSLLIPGTVGALSGAWVVSQVDGKLLKPWVSGYLLLMGLYILYKAYRAYRHRQAVQARAATAGQIAPLAVLGGFVDSVGGGGWGPVVTTTLLGRGHAPPRNHWLGECGGVLFDPRQWGGVCAAGRVWPLASDCRAGAGRHAGGTLCRTADPPAATASAAGDGGAADQRPEPVQPAQGTGLGEDAGRR